MAYNKALLIEYRVSRSRETIEDARLALESGRLHAAENRIYYAGFYMVSALALINDFSTSKHSQLLGWFNKNYVKTEIISSEMGRIYADAFVNRKESDYQDYIVLEIDDIKFHYEEMVKFLDAVLTQIKSLT